MKTAIQKSSLSVLFLFKDIDICAKQQKDISKCAKNEKGAAVLMLIKPIMQELTILQALNKQYSLWL
ncbi:MAG: hypothetical protein BGO69_08510 [Bacteroidetes bacterium 46-16]|nr:MAG: hypothetical protein BGO69_08510 [Bacteroidetes bacterium 46-16]